MVQVFIYSANVPSCRDVVTDVLLLSHCVAGLLAYNSALYICISVTNRYGTGGRRQAHGLVYGWYRNVLCMHPSNYNGITFLRRNFCDTNADARSVCGSSITL